MSENNAGGGGFVRPEAAHIPAVSADILGQIFRGFVTGEVPGLKKQRHASQSAINSLKKVDLAKLEDKVCGICMDAYFDESKLPKGSFPITDTSELAKYGAFFEGVYDDDPPIMFVPPGNQGLDDIEYHPASSEFGFEQTPEGAETDLSESSDHIPVKMPTCDHVFGRSCIVSWLREHTTCPMCRTEVEADPVPQRQNHRGVFIYYVTPLAPREASTSLGNESGDPPIMFATENPSMVPVREERTGPSPSDPTPTDLPHDPNASDSHSGSPSPSSAGPVRGSDRSANRAHPYAGQSWQ